MTREFWFVFAGGGTGGHLFPALAVVESLRSRGARIDVSFFCTDRAIDGEILRSAQVAGVPLGVRPLSGYPWHWPALLLRWRKSVSACVKAFSERRPAVVVGAGGYASGPPVAAGVRLGIPTFVLNPDAVPGRANRYLGRRHGRALAGIFVQWSVTRNHFPPTAPVVVTGCPVRCGFRSVSGADVPELRRSFGLELGRRTLLVTGASQGARTINEAMIELAGVVASAGWQVLHLSGPADAERVARGYAKARDASVSPTFHYRVVPFTERMSEAMAAADLVVSRAGASTLAEILAVGRPAILLPYPFHRDRHQWHNAAVAVEAGAAARLEDQRDAWANAEQLAPVLRSLLADDLRREAMARAARGLARPQAADLIADLLCETAGNRRAEACEILRQRAVSFTSRRTA